MLSLISCKSNKKTLFENVSSFHSNISFVNEISETDSLNPLTSVNIYNGGGVGIGDFNKDGLQDIYFVGNQVPSKLYLNKGDFEFDDVTEDAGVDGSGRWARGVAVVDINNDGLKDIYLCTAMNQDNRNVLYVNQGIGKGGIPVFRDMAKEYGLEVKRQSTMANFFDYDNDGDLDVYITVNAASSFVNPSEFRRSENFGRIYRNDWDPKKKHGFFTEATNEAKLFSDGYGHSTVICDLNLDGWKDIYVTNDFIPGNTLYINNQDGTFTNRSKEYFKHTSFNAMGQDIIDINNDGLADVFELDMSPRDNYRRKTMLMANNNVTYQNFDFYGFQYQYIRNTLQINQGPRVLGNDSIGAPVFSDIAFVSGLAQTDWSWTPLITDFDNDSYRDIIITNGFPKDVSDQDFVVYNNNKRGGHAFSDLAEKIPQIKLRNYAFKNKNGTDFTDVSEDWGFSEPSFSNGSAYADLDNDGDLDFVINNINDKAQLYRNTLRNDNNSGFHFLQVALEGEKQNLDGFGAFISIYYQNGKKQVFENTPYRGYLSTHQNLAHFGLGKTSVVDSVVVLWPDKRVQVIKDVKADRELKVNIRDARTISVARQEVFATESLFKEITYASGIAYKHKDDDFVDFNIQTAMPHKLSEYSPALAAGDVDGNGLEDLVMGGNSKSPARVFLQQANGKFLQKEVYAQSPEKSIVKDAGILLIDVDGNKTLDLYIASGGYEQKRNTISYQDRLFLNDGKGNFILAKDALPQNFISKLCVRAFDYNKDGNLDLFVSGRVEPWNYPKPVSSFIYRNDSKNGTAKFTDVTAEVAPELQKIGLVADALFTDFDNDNQTDLILVGEWMPVTFLKNDKGRFKNVTQNTGVAGELGWWNSITAGDFRNTGRTDYIVGNLGLNSFYRGDKKHPVFITAKDFDGNGGYEAFPSLFLPDNKGKTDEYPALGRDDMLDRLPAMKKRFNSYDAFAKESFNEILTPEQRKGALRLKATNLNSCYFRNEGGGKFTVIPLPAAAQVSLLNAMVTDDFDKDGNLDVLINGNDFGTEVSTGRYDAFNGLLLKGNGKGGFKPLSILKSGVFIPGNGKALVKFRGAKDKCLLAASQRQEALKLFELKKPVKTVKLLPDDVYAIISFNAGQTRKEEFYHGSSFLSQSARFIEISKSMKSVEVVNASGKKRIISP